MAEEQDKKDGPKINEDLPDGIKDRMRHLKQYGGKKKPLEPLPDAPIPIEQVKAELATGTTLEVPMISGSGVRTIPITAKAVLNANEYKIYATEVSEWLDSHPDWMLKEDMDDVYNIAMEKVIQYRLLLKRKRSPKSDIEKDYNSSIYRMQAFRQNLAARRSDRISGKGKVVNQTNVAIIASEMDAGKIEELKRRVLNHQKEEEELFPIIDSEQ